MSSRRKSSSMFYVRMCVACCLLNNHFIRRLHLQYVLHFFHWVSDSGIRREDNFGKSTHDNNKTKNDMTHAYHHTTLSMQHS